MTENTEDKATLTEDTSDIAAFEARANEPDFAFENVVEDLKRRGKI